MQEPLVGVSLCFEDMETEIEGGGTEGLGPLGCGGGNTAGAQVCCHSRGPFIRSLWSHWGTEFQRLSPWAQVTGWAVMQEAQICRLPLLWQNHLGSFCCS